MLVRDRAVFHCNYENDKSLFFQSPSKLVYEQWNKKSGIFYQVHPHRTIEAGNKDANNIFGDGASYNKK